MVMTVSPGSNLVVIPDGSPLIFIRRDPRAAVTASPGHHVDVLTLQLKLGVGASQLRVLGPGGLFDIKSNPGQHIFSAVAQSPGKTGLPGGIGVGMVRIEAASGVVFTKDNSGMVELKLQNQYGSAIPPELSSWGGDWWTIGHFDDVRDGLELIADWFARLNDVKLKYAPTGYCTWGSEKFGGADNQKEIVKLAQYQAETFKPDGFKFVQIDDGWEGGGGGHGVEHAFWKFNPNGPYGHGMKPVADAIKRLGLTPGLWMLPFGTYTDPYRGDIVNMLVKAKDGKPYNCSWGGFSLDLTRPETRRYVHEFISRAVHEWGYQLLKLDGLYTGLACRQTYPQMSYVSDSYGDAVFSDPHMSNMQAARLGLKTVRDAAGHKTFILGCCAPQNERSLGMVLGLVDAMRIAPDNNSADWPGMITGAYGASPICFLNGRVWWNDPDRMFARASVPRRQFITYGSWVALTGGLNYTCDWSPDYPHERVADLRCMMPAHQLNSVRPVDFMESDPCRVWLLDYAVDGEKHQILGLFNWQTGGRPWQPVINLKAAGLDAEAYDAFDFWQAKPLQDIAELGQPIGPQHCRIIALRPVSDRPRLVSTSRHVSQGAIELRTEKFDAASGVLHVVSQVVGRQSYELRLALRGAGANWRIKSVACMSQGKKEVVPAVFKQKDGWGYVTITPDHSGEVAFAISCQKQAQGK